MEWGKFIFKSVLIYSLLGCIIYFMGDLLIRDMIVPEKGISIDDWLDAYNYTLVIVILLSFSLSALWFFIGSSYSGNIGISLKHNFLWLFSVIIGILLPIFMFEPSQEGALLGNIGIIIIPLVGFYLSSILAYAEQVKYIPPFAMKIHR